MKQNIQIQPRNKNEKQASQFIIQESIKNNIKSKRELLLLHKRACEKYKINFVTNPMLLNTYRQLIMEKRIETNKDLFELLRKRRIRTSSGIASVAVLTKPYSCPGKCIFCPTQKNVPKSYINNEPAVMRAILAKYDPVNQINIRLKGFELAGNPTDKIELIVMGGTFSYLPRVYQLKFIIGCFMACNTYSSQFQMSNVKCQINNKIQISNLKKLKLPNNKKELLKILNKEQRKNERAKYRIVGLTLETRPDYINEREINWMRMLGCTRVELGVQSIYDDVLKKNNRGHNVEAIVKATKLLKNAGFKVCYHMMPNLYGSNFKNDLKMFKTIFADSRFQPDMIKIYPCVVTKYAKLAKYYSLGKFILYTDEELIKLITKIKAIIPQYVRIQRLIRDIPADNIIAGSKISNLRQILHSQKINCQCIRCREIREDIKLQVTLRRIDYDASDGKEIFLQYIDKNDRIYALLRLRIIDNPIICHPEFISGSFEIPKRVRNDNIIYNCAIIREVHTYGPMLEIGKISKKDPQHSGLGKKLIKHAEQITQDEFGIKKIAVISGVGVRNYYRKLGYKLQSTYMIKKL